MGNSFFFSLPFLVPPPSPKPQRYSRPMAGIRFCFVCFLSFSGLKKKKKTTFFDSFFGSGGEEEAVEVSWRWMAVIASSIFFFVFRVGNLGREKENGSLRGIFFFFFQKVISSKTAPPHSQLTRNIFVFIFFVYNFTLTRDRSMTSIFQRH